MPLWQIYHTEGIFNNVASKQALVNDITSYYTSLPKFYVVVQFFPMPSETTWVGGKTELEKPFVRVVINHVAITGANAPDADQFYARLSSRINEILRPHVHDKGYDSEYHVSETDRRIWRLNGLIPPPWKSEAEKEWIEANKTLPYEGDH